MSSFKHEPVMAREVFDLLTLKPGDTYLDCTLGGAGHALIAAAKVGPSGTVIGLDVDEDALGAANERLSSAECKVIIYKSSYAQLDSVLGKIGIDGVDGILFDLGVSSFQLDEADRGFTYKQDAPLDMRMDKSLRRTAEDIVNDCAEDQLIRILRDYGEEKWASRIAKFIVTERSKSRIAKASDLVKVIEAAVPRGAREKGQHPARRSFQALRIAVNAELENIETAIPKSIAALKPGGRLVVLSYHSLEDRITKNLFRKSEDPCTCPPDIPVCVCGKKPQAKVLTRKPILAKDEEIESNPRSRSAKLRGLEKIACQE